MARELRDATGGGQALDADTAHRLAGEQVARGVEREGLKPVRLANAASTHTALREAARIFAEEGVAEPDTCMVLGLLCWMAGATYTAEELTAIVREEAERVE